MVRNLDLEFGLSSEVQWKVKTVINRGRNDNHGQIYTEEGYSGCYVEKYRKKVKEK